MKTEEVTNLDLDIYNLLKPFDESDDIGALYLRSSATPESNENDSCDMGAYLGGDFTHIINAVVANMQCNEEVEVIIMNGVANFLAYDSEKLEYFKGLLKDIDKARISAPILPML